MKKLAIITLVLFAGLFANAQKETRKLSSFSEISVQEAIDAYIKSGDKGSPNKVYVNLSSGGSIKNTKT